MQKPRDLYEIVADEPADDAAPVLLHAFSGFIDAGNAGALAADHVIDTLGGRVVARFDCDQLIDYRGRRPAMTFEGDHFADAQRFSLTLQVITDENGREFYMLRGPEPDLQWERFTAAVGELVDRFAIKLTVNGHGIPWAAPHTRPLRMTAHASRRELIAGSPRWIESVRVPGNVSALLELRLGEVGVDSMGFAVHVPHYLSEIEYPPAAVSLLDAIGEAASLALPTKALRDAGVGVLANIDEQVRAAPQLAEAITGMERAFDGEGLPAGDGPRLPESEIPHGDDLAAEVEDFLRGMGG